MTKPMFEVGSSVSTSRTIAESDLYLFAGLTGDLGRNHMDEEYCKGTSYGRRVVHGAYMVGLASSASTLMGDTFEKGRFRGASYGYDKVRFVRPVFIGDTITMTYTITELFPETLRTHAQVIGTNQRGEVCFAALHIAQGLPPAASAAP
jgi:3-hydroxybutyryl-CoA dehydratase